MRTLKSIWVLALLLLTMPATVWAQVTTGTISGIVSGPSNLPLDGATVTAVHEPTGTKYTGLSRKGGTYSLQNLRVGGPYTVEVSFVGLQTNKTSDITIKLDEPYVLNVTLAEKTSDLQEVVVSAFGRSKLINSKRTGTLTTVDSRQILAMPTISRSMNDMIRMTPQATSTSTGAIGGGNYRQNYITVDGADFNNTFGIGTNLPAGGSPISLDALEEIAINITPFDVKQSGFVGSAVNAVTRSGTNKFSGSAYTFWRSEKQQGNEVGKNTPFTKQNLDDRTIGFRIGGPIIKNKLFFFLNAESGKRTSPGQQNFAATTSAPFGSSPNIARPTNTELDAISQYLFDKYGYETGPYDGYDLESENQRFVARVDWNISTKHRLNVRYSQVESKSPSFVSTSRTPLTAYATGAGRTNINALWYKNTNYYQEANFYSLATELFSNFGKVNNTFRFTYTNQNDPRSSDSKIFPFVDILKDGSPFTSFGYEPFTYGNLRDVQAYSAIDYLTWTMGKHNLTAGVQFDLQTTKNGFQRFGTAYYTFNSWDDFVNGVKPRDYAITYSLEPGYAQAFPSFKFAQYAAYIQDEFKLSDKVRLTAGIRAEMPTYLDVDEIKTHPMVEKLSFENGEKINTGILPENRLVLSPRVGFNWDVKGDRSLQVRGGTGIFTGRVPTVWIVAQSGDAGLLQFTQVVQGQANTPGPFNPDPRAYLPATPPAAGTAIPSSVSTTDTEFRFPQTWKTTLGVDAKLPWGMVGTFEGIYNKDMVVALGRNPNLIAPQNLNVSGYPDNRPIYGSGNSTRFINPITSAGQPWTSTMPSSQAQSFNPVVLDNQTNKGYYLSLSLKLEKQFTNGFSAMAAYVKNYSENIYDGSGDQLLNTWSLTQIRGTANNPELSYANYVVPSRVIVSMSYRKEYLKNLATSVSLFFEGSSQGRFSYTYGGDFNRDGQTNDLIYIPKDPSEITFTNFNYGSSSAPNNVTAAQQSEIFFKYIEQDDYLREHKGEYAERNGALMPWRNQVDLRLTQEIFGKAGANKNKLEFTLDIFNFGNLLNKDWGIVQTINASSVLVPTNQNSLVPGGTVKPTFRLQTDRGNPVSTTYRDNNSLASTYYMQFGLRYSFN